MESLHSEVNAIRHAVNLQADIGEDLRAVTAIIDNRVSNVERRLEISRKGGHGLDSLCELKNACEGETAGAPTVEYDVGLEVTSGAGSWRPELWPEGSIVRRYYEPRKVRAVGADIAASTSGASVSEGAAVAECT
ncbi:hypothetical protein G5714_022018 [Onychostoma macrolepis]|uniref:Uncharacterized protein n=1 Tax=Onychostoma macrolepis TaxID=369639 RepID=A0A7J6BSN6_9TELE|nr:hypothetical protein G5714_022018 [Onychostoma macrolepis]